MRKRKKAAVGKRSELFEKFVENPKRPQIRTFGDLEKFLNSDDRPLFSDMAALERVRDRKKRANWG
jgi:hypothetical protein